MKSLALQQVSSKFARRNAARTLDKPIALKHIRSYLSPEILASLEAACREGFIYVWGAKEERHHQTYKMLGRDSWVLFRQERYIYKHAIMIERTSNEELAESLWGRDEDGEAWNEVFFFARVKDKRILASSFNKAIGRSENDNWQGLVVLPLKESEKLSAFFEKQLEGL